jgi:hypothetical protein
VISLRSVRPGHLLNITARSQNSRHAPVELENHGPTHPKKKKKKKKKNLLKKKKKKTNFLQIKSKSNNLKFHNKERIIYGK